MKVKLISKPLVVLVLVHIIGLIEGIAQAKERDLSSYPKACASRPYYFNEVTGQAKPALFPAIYDGPDTRYLYWVPVDKHGVPVVDLTHYLANAAKDMEKSISRNIPPPPRQSSATIPASVSGTVVSQKCNAPQYGSKDQSTGTSLPDMGSIKGKPPYVIRYLMHLRNKHYFAGDTFTQKKDPFSLVPDSRVPPLY